MFLPDPTNATATLGHRLIPDLPERPRVHPISTSIRRSYSVGRERFSRAFAGEVLTLSITSEEPIPPNVRARLVTTLNGTAESPWIHVPYETVDDKTLCCRLTPERTGLHSFRTEFSRRDDEVWLRDSVPDAWIMIDPPQVDGLRLYSLIPNVSGTVADWRADLPRIAALGFNAIHLLPITQLDASQSPYAAFDLFTIDPAYLPADAETTGWNEFEQFVAQAREMGMRLCFDLVLNHVGITSKMAVRAPDWIKLDQNEADGLQRARYWSGSGWQTWEDLALINYEHPSEATRAEIWAYMIDYALFWAKYANDTGGFVRFDNLHSSDPVFVQAMTAALQSEFPGVAVVAEYFTDDVTLLRTVPAWGLHLTLATPWQARFAPELREYLRYIHRLSEQVRYFMPITSHDSGAPAEEFGTAESTVPRYVAAALMGTGATGMPQGVEFGESHRINFIGRQPKVVWPGEARFAKLITSVNAILAENAAFRCGQNCEFVDGDHPAILAAFRSNSDEAFSGFLIVCNFDTSNSQRIQVDLSSVLASEKVLTCKDLLSGSAFTAAGGRFDLELPPCGAQVLRLTNQGVPKKE